MRPTTFTITRADVIGTRLRCGLVGTWAILALPGCVDFNYSQIRLGQEQREYSHAFPEDKLRRTPAGFCYLQRDIAGRTDAVIVLLTSDRRVSAKLQAAHFERSFGFKTETVFELRGELDPDLLKLSAAGPIDTLRALADELTTVPGDAFAREAQSWVAAGLVRLMQRWPHIGDEGPAYPRLTSVLEQIPGGGQVRITVDGRGVYLIEYSQTAAR